MILKLKFYNFWMHIYNSFGFFLKTCTAQYLSNPRYDMDAPEAMEFPFGYKGKLKPFQVLLLLRCFRVDRVYRAVGDYITEVMGEEYIMPPVISMDNIFEQCSPTTPVVFILSPGSDPTAELMKLADR